MVKYLAHNQKIVDSSSTPAPISFTMYLTLYHDSIMFRNVQQNTLQFYPYGSYTEKEIILL